MTFILPLGAVLGVVYFIINSNRTHRLRIVSLATSCINEINKSSFDVFYEKESKDRLKAKGIVETQLSILDVYISVLKPFPRLKFTNIFLKNRLILGSTLRLPAIKPFYLSHKTIQEAISINYEEYIESIMLDTPFESQIIKEDVSDDTLIELMDDIYDRSVKLLKVLEQSAE